jgi:hypothetical protein
MFPHIENLHTQVISLLRRISRFLNSQFSNQPPPEGQNNSTPKSPHYTNTPSLAMLDFSSVNFGSLQGKEKPTFLDLYEVCLQLYRFFNQ